MTGLLLERARQARTVQGFTPITRSRVSLDVVFHAPAAQNPADATNYLGGIADVLENKAHRGTLEHLGDLADVWLYANDRQIKEATYREIEDRGSQLHGHYTRAPLAGPMQGQITRGDSAGLIAGWQREGSKQILQLRVQDRGPPPPTAHRGK